MASAGPLDSHPSAHTHSTSTSPDQWKKKRLTPLLDVVEDLLDQGAGLAAHGKAARRVRKHVLSSLVCLGRHTITQRIATAGGQFEDWSADYRLYSAARIEAHVLFEPVRRTLLNHLPADQPAVVAVDDTRLKKWSQKTPGVKYMRDPLGPPFQTNLQLSQRFLQLSMAWRQAGGYARMIPIDFQHTPPPNKPSRSASPQEWEQYRQAQRQQALPRVANQRVCALRQALDDEGQQERRLVCTVDGGYTNKTFLKDLPGRVTVIGRVRGDAKLYFLPEQQPDKGRRRVYGTQAPTPEELRADGHSPWISLHAFACGRQHEFQVKSLAPLRWRATGETYTLRLVVIRPLAYRLRQGGKLLYRKPAYLLCSDPNMTLEDILQYYLWRWDIEVNFRDEKTLLGVGQAQVHHPLSVEAVPTLSVASYALLLTAASKLSGLVKNDSLLPPPKWQKGKPLRPTTQDLIRQLRHDLWGRSINFTNFVSTGPHNTKSLKCLPDLHSSVFYGASVT